MCMCICVHWCKCECISACVQQPISDVCESGQKLNSRESRIECASSWWPLKVKSEWRNKMHSIQLETSTSSSELWENRIRCQFVEFVGNTKKCNNLWAESNTILFPFFQSQPYGTSMIMIRTAVLSLILVCSCVINLSVQKLYSSSK